MIAAEAGTKNPVSSGPVRTCIGCKQTEARKKLVRLVRSTSESGEPEALVDVRGHLPGRGAWLHPGQECLRLAVKRRAIGRALPGVVNVAVVEAQLENQCRQAN